ncbi:hypothetical protein BGX38DRAFT_1274398 [Terfezia claveryi]|nr:hypothetical protein BGX38DRAFT_1274398 [Terfezia claveryi]
MPRSQFSGDKNSPSLVILQDLEGDWKREPDSAKREIILKWRIEEIIKLQEEAQSKGEADEVGSGEEHTGAPHTHVLNTGGERYTDAQNELLEIECGGSTSEFTGKAKSGEPVKRPKSTLKGEVNESLELSDRENDDVFCSMSKPKAGLDFEVKLETEGRLEPGRESKAQDSSSGIGAKETQ